jgi:hypothetical protein
MESYTPEEREIVDLIIQAHNKFCELERTHVSEIPDWVGGVHLLQDILGRRILRRVFPDDFSNIKGK